MRFSILFLLLGSMGLGSCHHEEDVDFDTNTCKRIPSFVQKLGFDQKRSFFSTADKRKMGLLLIENSITANVPPKVFQDPSWSIGGWLAPIMLDGEGNIFTAPAPFINVLNNPAIDQNTIYKVDANSGVMQEYMRLPLADSTIQNAYGIIGMAYLCETGTLYVSSVSGSDRLHERGVIYAIDTKQNKIIDQLMATDAVGIGITYITGQRELFFGSARTSDINSIVLDKDGKFSGKAKLAFTISGLGPRGDDKVRRITADKAGNLNIAGMEFNFNLIAPSEKQETNYKATYYYDEKRWLVE